MFQRRTRRVSWIFQNPLNSSSMLECCFPDMHLYFDNLSDTARIFPPKRLQKFPTCISCRTNFTISQYSLGSEDNRLVFEIDCFSRDPTMMTDDKSSLLGKSSPMFLLPEAFISDYISVANSNFIFYVIN